MQGSEGIAADRRRYVIAVLLIAAAACAPPATAEDMAAHKPVCLDVYRIDHTEILSNHQILFHMHGRQDWVNTLASPCATLTREDGFIWKSRIARYCDNLESIRVIRSGEVCLLGAFTPYEKPHAS